MYTTLHFNDEITPVDFFSGRYVVYIFGAKYVKADPDFHLRITDKETRETVAVHEYRFKTSDHDGVRYFWFDIPKTATYEVSIHSYKNIRALKTRLFSIGLLFPPVDLKEFRILIERRR